LTVYKNMTLDEERALYGVSDAVIQNCRFDGPLDGESALKESRNIDLTGCDFNLRYPLWHVERGLIDNCRMTENCRAALWYDNEITIKNSIMNGIKAVRECTDITIQNCRIESPEFGWLSRKIDITDTVLNSEYPFLFSSGLYFNNFTLHGKYSFQYVKDVQIEKSFLDTKDAFWHSKNVTVTDSIVKGEYLGWYSENLKLIRCRIIGTQPLCYADNLILEDCEMIHCDLAFEKSHVNAVVKGSIDSVKNPLSGSVSADSIGEIIYDDDAESSCKIITNEKKAEEEYELCPGCRPVLS